MTRSIDETGEMPNGTLHVHKPEARLSLHEIKCACWFTVPNQSATRLDLREMREIKRALDAILLSEYTKLHSRNSDG